MTDKEKASGINPPDLPKYEQGTEEIIASKKDSSIIHKNEQQSLKETRANAEETRKLCFETAETSRKIN